MTTKELNDRVKVTWAGTCQYDVTILYRGKTYHCKSNNSLAWDSMDEECDGTRQYTFKQSLYAFYKECIYKNNLHFREK